MHDTKAMLGDGTMILAPKYPEGSSRPVLPGLPKLLEVMPTKSGGEAGQLNLDRSCVRTNVGVAKHWNTTRSPKE